MNIRKIYTIAYNTYRESVRSKILYAVFFFAILVVSVSSVFGMVTIGNKVKVLKDFGLLSLSLFGLLYVVVTGSSLLQKELARKTIFNILSKPVSRSEFVIGKYFGMLMTFTFIFILMSAALSLFIYFYEGQFDPVLLVGYYGIFLQVVILCALTILFSALLVTPILSGGIVFCCFVIGRSSDFILQIIQQFELTGLLKQLFEKIYYVIPHLDKLDCSNQVVYGVLVENDRLLWNTVYALSYAACSLLIAGWLFSRREFN